jgi:hypothetical protein
MALTTQEAAGPGGQRPHVVSRQPWRKPLIQGEEDRQAGARAVATLCQGCVRRQLDLACERGR